MRLPDFPLIADEALATLARRHHIPVSKVTPLPDIGITNRMYRFGEHLMLRVPRDHPHIINLLRKEAKVVPAARAIGVQTPAILFFDDACDVLPVPYTLYEQAHGETLGLLDLEPEATPEVWRGCIRRSPRQCSRLKRWATATICAPRQKSLPKPGCLP